MRYLYIIASVFVLTTLTSCFKDYEERYLFTDNRVEFDDAVINPNISTSKPYPMLPTVSMDAGTVKFKVNMTGEQKNVDRSVSFRVVPEETTAVEGVDYTLPKGSSFVIPANSSFGYVEIQVLEGGSGIPTIHLELLETEDIGVMDRYHRVSFKILYLLTMPNPNDVEEINDILFFKNLTIGGQSNQNIGNAVDMKNGGVYVIEGANRNQDKIDFILMHSTASAVNIIAPSTANSNLTGFASTKHIPTDWTIRNAGVLIRLPNPTPEELALFENAMTVSDITNAFTQMEATVSTRPGYSSTNDGPSTRVRTIVQGDLILFRSTDRGVISIIKVAEMVTGTTGHLLVQAKSGEF